MISSPESCPDSGYESGQLRAIAHMDASHWINHPAHASALIKTLNGHIRTLAASTESDPVLFAYQCQDHLPKVAGLVIAIQKWASAVIEATPDQVYETGAQVCR